MLGIGVSLRHLRGTTAAVDAYKVAGFKPDLVFDFEQEYYRTGGSQTTFDSAMTHSRSSNATMVDSDGLLKWAPHNLLTYSEDLTDADWVENALAVSGNATIAPDGTLTADRIETDGTNSEHYIYNLVTSFTVNTNHSIRVWLKPDEYRYVAVVSSGGVGAGRWAAALFDLSGSGSVVKTGSGASGTHVSSQIISVSDGWYFCELIFRDANSAGFQLIPSLTDNPTFGDFGRFTEASTNGDGFYAWGAHLYRSDLGGMVDNPDTGNSYVPTTSAARYLARRGHHVYNGAEWVNEGVLVEPTAATNLLTYSNDPTNVDWTNPAGRISVGAETLNGPFGTYRSLTNTVTGTGAHQIYQIGKTLVSGETYAAFSLVKYSSGSGWFVVNMYDTTDANTRAWFDVQNGVKGTADAGISDYDIEDWGDGWYLCWATKTASSTSGGVSFETPNGDGVGAYTSGDQIFFAGAQFEASSTSSSYIPTSGSTVTRAADTLTVPSANLPWPTPNVIGPELVTNGTFDTDLTGWSEWLTPTTSVVSGAAQVIGDAFEGLYQNVSVTAGRVYRITFDIPTKTGAVGYAVYAQADLAGTALVSNPNTNTGSFEVLLTATTSVFSIVFWSRATGVTFTFDNISVREIDPLAVSIQMEGRATGDTLTTTRWYLDANNYITQEINTSDFTFEQANAGTVDAVTGGSFTSGVNTAFNFASTHASTLVAAAVGGTALTDNTTPTALADLSSTDMALAYSGGPMILKKVRMWPANITEAGREEASA